MARLLVSSSFFLFLVGLVTLAYGTERRPCYEFTIFVPNEPERLPLPYENKAGEKIFSDSIEAVSIEWVRVNGMTIDPARIEWDLGVHRLVILRPASRIYAYSVEKTAILTYRNMTKHDSHIYKFVIPPDFDVLEIGYRIRLPSGKVSAELCSKGTVIGPTAGPDGYPAFGAAFAK
ncbi:MAG: hypothetical protein SF187_18130 [Deltaproteobacteria bacterium]|nr:hypothetical protein [Deltaproteobacteria bacterium]